MGFLFLCCERVTNPTQLSSQNAGTGIFLFLTSAVYYSVSICQQQTKDLGSSALTFHPNHLHLSRLLKETFSWSSVRINIFKLHMQKDQHQLFSLTIDVSLVKQNGCKKRWIISPHKLTKLSRQLYAQLHTPVLATRSRELLTNTNIIRGARDLKQSLVPLQAKFLSFAVLKRAGGSKVAEDSLFKCKCDGFSISRDREEAFLHFQNASWQ